MRKKSQLLCGVGINDSDTAIAREAVVDGVRQTVWRCIFYQCWSGMIQRCYSQKEKLRNYSYRSCSSVPEWLYFTKFRAWMQEQDWEGNCLDKDLLYPGNKVYGPDTCLFVSQAVNNFIVEKVNLKGDWPTGVNFNKHAGRFRARCRNVETGEQDFLGYFDDPHTAHRAWLEHKIKQAYILASKQTDERVAKALIDKYENYKINLDARADLNENRLEKHQNSTIVRTN